MRGGEELESDEPGREIEAVDVEEVERNGELREAWGLADGQRAQDAAPEEEDDWEAIEESEELDDTFESRQVPEGLVELYRAHKKPALTVAVDPSSPGSFCSGSQDDTLCLWALGGSTPRCTKRFAETVSLVRYSFNGELLFAATLDGSIHVLDPRAEQCPLRRSLCDFDGEVTVG